MCAFTCSPLRIVGGALTGLSGAVSWVVSFPLVRASCGAIANAKPARWLTPRWLANNARVAGFD
jgi:hypothetical protein